jgi:hypothetical protein
VGANQFPLPFISVEAQNLRSHSLRLYIFQFLDGLQRQPQGDKSQTAEHGAKRHPDAQGR